MVLWPQAFSTVARHLYFEASAMIIGLINLGHALERLLELTPPSSRIVVDDREHFTLLAQVTPGVTLRLTSGDWVPVDGDIFQGEV